MKKMTVYWGVLIVAIGVVFVWLFLSLFSLYRVDREEFSNEINDKMYHAVYNMNMLQAGITPENHYCGINGNTRQIVYFRGSTSDTITFPNSVSMIEANNRAMYDIRTPYWSLEKLDSLFHHVLGKEITVFYFIQDSTGKMIDSYGNRKDFSGNVMEGRVELGFLARHELHYEYMYPFSLFFSTHVRLNVIVVVLFAFLVFCLISLFYSLRQAKIDEYNRDLMVSMIIHNLQTPLSDLVEIQAQLEETMIGQLEKEDREIVNMMHDELASMSATVTGLLNLSCIANGIKINKEEIDLLDLFQNILSRYEATIPLNKEVNFVLHFDLKKNLVLVDPNHLTEIIRNLIDNSIKYSGREVLVEIIGEENEKGIVIRFRDNGYGIAKGNLEKIFDPFSREDTEKKENGHGLGLFYVKLAVEAHGGKVKVNPLEKGTEMMITIPR